MSEEIDALKAQIEELKTLIGGSSDQAENILNSDKPPQAKHQVVSFVCDGSMNLGEFRQWASSQGIMSSIMPLFEDISSSPESLKKILNDMAGILHDKSFAKERVERLDRHQSDKQSVIRAAGGESE